MSLPTISGRGFLISDGIELKFSKNGVAYARLPLVFKNTRKTDEGWTHDKEILIQGTVFGKLAESLADTVSGRTDLNISGELYTEEYEGKSYTRMNVHAAWPAKEDAGRAPASVGSHAADNFPF
jgi:single-stranded DNA-binding protein